MKLTGIAASLALALCAIAPPAHAETEKLSVVATFSIIGDFARVVGGDRIELRTLVGPDSDAHVYEPKPADAIALARADVVLVNGLLFEGFLQRLVEASGTTASIATLTDGANIVHDPDGGHYHYVNGEAVFHAAPNDPHAWQSGTDAKCLCRDVATSPELLCTADGGCCSGMQAARGLLDEPARTRPHEDRAGRRCHFPRDRGVPSLRGKGLPYWARDYGQCPFLVQAGRVSTESETSSGGDVASLHSRSIREKAGRRPSLQEIISDARLVRARISHRRAGLALAGQVYSDALSPADGPAATYVDLMRHNVHRACSLGAHD